MTRSILVYGALLVLLGVAAYAISGAASATALIPAVVGVPVLVLGIIAMYTNVNVTYVAIAAVAIAVLALLGSIQGIGDLVSLIAGDDVERPVAAVAQSLTVVLSAGFIANAVRWWAATKSAASRR